MTDKRRMKYIYAFITDDYTVLSHVADFICKNKTKSERISGHCLHTYPLPPAPSYRIVLIWDAKG